MPLSEYEKKELCVELFEYPDCFSVVFDPDQLDGNTDGKTPLIYQGLMRFSQIIQEKTYTQFNSEVSYADGKLKLILKTNEQCVKEMLKKITESKNEEYLVVVYSILKPWAYLNGILGSQNWREKFPFRLTYHETK